MYEALEKLSEQGWPFNACGMKQDAEQHAEHAELVPSQKHFPQIEMDACFFLSCSMLCLIILCKRKAEKYKQDILESADNLCVGEANLIVKNEGAKASECADIGEHGTHEISTAVQKVLMASGKGQCADETWQQDIDKAEGRQPEKLGRERQDPEAQQRQDGAYNDDIETDELVANLIGNDVLLMQIVAKCERQYQIGKYKKYAELCSIHDVVLQFR